MSLLKGPCPNDALRSVIRAYSSISCQTILRLLRVLRGINSSWSATSKKHRNAALSYVPTLRNYRNLSFATNFVDEVTSKNGATFYEEVARFALHLVCKPRSSV